MNEETKREINILRDTIKDLSNKIDKYDRDFSVHFHDGNTSQRINLQEILGTIQTTNIVPTGNPVDLYDQIRFYSSGTTYRLYIYDTLNKIWRYTSLT